jgi:CheY-like chemotaxis protein
MAKILMLDDDEDALAWMSAALESRGHQVKAFSGPRAALESLADGDPDLIVSDFLMPEMDGLAFARVVRRHRATPLMFVSIAKKQAEAIIAGAIGYLQKPASATELRDAVERVLGERARRATLLVVDDDRDIVDLYTAFLEPHFWTLTAPNGKAALEVLRSHRVDLAIVDVHMPVMNGVELVRAIRNDPALQTLPIIVQTNDRVAAQAPVWGLLRVSQVMDKAFFLDWFDAQLRTVHPAETK